MLSKQLLLVRGLRKPLTGNRCWHQYCHLYLCQSVDTRLSWGIIWGPDPISETKFLILVHFSLKRFEPRLCGEVGRMYLIQLVNTCSVVHYVRENAHHIVVLTVYKNIFLNTDELDSHWAINFCCKTFFVRFFYNTGIGMNNVMLH